MSDRSAKADQRRRSPWLRRADQAAIGAVALLSIAATAGYWLVQGGASGRLIELDRAPRQSVQFQINVNEADWPEFSQLPGIGEALARRIVESRAAEGAYADLDELQRVRGIGPKTLERIRPYLRPLPGAGNVAGQ